MKLTLYDGKYNGEKVLLIDGKKVWEGKELSIYTLFSLLNLDVEFKTIGVGKSEPDADDLWKAFETHLNSSGNMSASEIQTRKEPSTGALHSETDMVL